MKYYVNTYNIFFVYFSNQFVYIWKHLVYNTFSIQLGGFIKMSTFPERLKELLSKKGVSLREVARSIEVSNSLLSKYQNGIHSPKIDVVKKLADYFNVSVEYMSGSDNISANLNNIIKYANDNGLTEEDLKDLIEAAIKIKRK